MDELHARLLEAYHRAAAHFRVRPREAGRRFEAFIGSQLAAPIRSWALVLRANDSRISELRHSPRAGVDVDGDASPGQDGRALCGGDYEWASHTLTLSRGVIARLCAPVRIDWPGVRIDAAAAALGVSRKTIWEWFGGRHEGTEARRHEGEIGGPRDQGTEGWRERHEGTEAGRHEGAETGWRSGAGLVPEASSLTHASSLTPQAPRRARRRGNEHLLGAPFWVGRVRRVARNGLVKDIYLNRADRKRDVSLYWTAAPVDPAGVLRTGPWGALRATLWERFHVEPMEMCAGNDARRVPGAMDAPGVEPVRRVQQVRRVRRLAAGRYERWQWVCPGAASPRGIEGPSHRATEARHGEGTGGPSHRATEGRSCVDISDPLVPWSLGRSVPSASCLHYCDKLYWCLPVWTIAAMFGEDEASRCRAPLAGGFLCRRCAGLVYESSEMNWGRGGRRGDGENGRRGDADRARKARSAAIAWDRFVRRLSANLVGGRMVEREGEGE